MLRNGVWVLGQYRRIKTDIFQITEIHVLFSYDSKPTQLPIHKSILHLRKTRFMPKLEILRSSQTMTLEK